MQIYVNIKTAGKRKNILTKKPHEVPETIHSLREILLWFTRREVEAFNLGLEEKRVPILDVEQLLAGAEVGKITFGERRSEKQADLKEACEVTICAWKDGLIRVFLNKDELEQLDEEINLQNEDVLTFVRLTFLTGRMW